MLTRRSLMASWNSRMYRELLVLFLPTVMDVMVAVLPTMAATAIAAKMEALASTLLVSFGASSSDWLT